MKEFSVEISIWGKDFGALGAASRDACIGNGVRALIEGSLCVQIANPIHPTVTQSIE